MDCKFELRDVDANHPAMQVAMPVVSEHNGEAGKVTGS